MRCGCQKVSSMKWPGTWQQEGTTLKSDLPLSNISVAIWSLRLCQSPAKSLKEIKTLFSCSLQSDFQQLLNEFIVYV